MTLRTLLIGRTKLLGALKNIPIDGSRIAVGTIWSAYLRLVRRRPCWSLRSKDSFVNLSHEEL